MAGVDKFGAAFAVGFMVLMLAFMGGLTPGNPDSIMSPPPQRDLMEEQTQAMLTPPPIIPSQPESSSSSVVEENLTGVLRYTISGGLVENISPGGEENSIKIDLDTRLDGQFTIYITPNVIESFSDGSYFVLVDGEENHEFIQSQNKLTIDFLAGAEEIMIFGEQSDMYSMDHEAAADKAAADKAAADKAAADKAAADKAAADKAAADKAAADKAAADKAAADKAAADKAAAAAAKAPMSAEVVPVAGSATPGCEPECYDPSTVTISAGGTVTFVNSDTAPHTVTSGTATDGPDGVWDSSLIMIDMSYSVTLDDSGSYPYFCMVHPWMQGTIIVE